jgi:hypothetical protein
MGGGALVCFRAGTVNLPVETFIIIEELHQFLAYQIPECQVMRIFGPFRSSPRLDNCVSGIPNTITRPSFGSLNPAAATVDPRLRSQEYGRNTD